MAKMNVFSVVSAPAPTAGGFSFGTALGSTAAAPVSTTSSLGLGSSLFAQKPAGGLSFNTITSSKETHIYGKIPRAAIALNVLN